MYMPRWVLHLLSAAAVITLGWFAGSLLSSAGDDTTASAPPTEQAPRPAPPRTPPPTSVPVPEPAPVPEPVEPDPVVAEATPAGPVPVRSSVGTRSRSGGSYGPGPASSPLPVPAHAPSGPPPVVAPPPKESERSVGGTNLATTGSGNLNVIASDGAIVLIGDNAQLNANTGPVSGGGILAIDAQDSQLSTRTAGSAAQVGIGEEPSND